LFFLKRQFKWLVGFLPSKGHLMTPPEQILVKRRLQILDHEDRMKAAMELLEKENRALKDLVVHLSTIVIRRVTWKK
jgi:hypothetical protein